MTNLREIGIWAAVMLEAAEAVEAEMKAASFAVVVAVATISWWPLDSGSIGAFVGKRPLWRRLIFCRIPRPLC